MSFTTSRSLDLAIRKKIRNTTCRKCCACHAKWHQKSPGCCACYGKCNASFENVAEVLRLPHKTTFDTWRNTSECHKVPRLPRKTTLQPLLKPSTRRSFAASPINTATAEENQRIETRNVGASKGAFRARLELIILRSPDIKETWYPRKLDIKEYTQMCVFFSCLGGGPYTNQRPTLYYILFYYILFCFYILLLSHEINIWAKLPATRMTHLQKGGHVKTCKCYPHLNPSAGTRSAANVEITNPYHSKLADLKTSAAYGRAVHGGWCKARQYWTMVLHVHKHSN